MSRRGRENNAFLRQHASKRLLTRLRSTASHAPLRLLFDSAEGGLDGVMAVLSTSALGEVQAVVREWHKELAAVRRTIDLETWLEERNVQPSMVVGEYVRLAYDQGISVAKVMQGLALPEIMEASIRLAVKGDRDGYNERRMHLEQAGVVTPRQPAGNRGNQVAVMVGGGRRGRNVSVTSPDVTGLPPVVEDQRGLAERIRSFKSELTDGNEQMGEDMEESEAQDDAAAEAEAETD